MQGPYTSDDLIKLAEFTNAVLVYRLETGKVISMLTSFYSKYAYQHSSLLLNLVVLYWRYLY